MTLFRSCNGRSMVWGTRNNGLRYILSGRNVDLKDGL